MEARKNLGGSTKGPGPEKQLEDLFKLSLGAFFPDEHHVWKVHGNEFTPAGTPDFCGHLRSRFLGIELKVQPRAFTSDQIRKIRTFAKSGPDGIYGGLVLCQDSVYRFIPPSQFAGGFSYRDKEKWLPVVVRSWTSPSDQKKYPVLDLRFLTTLDYNP